MAERKIRFRVGSRRITPSIDPTTANYTRQIRTQMKSVEEGFTRFVDIIQANTPAAIEKVLTPIFHRSQELVPVKTGKLKASGFIEIRKSGKTRVQGEVGYARSGVPHYAVMQHENLDFQHKEPTQAKFLQQAVEENLNGALDQAAGVYAETLGF